MEIGRRWQFERALVETQLQDRMTTGANLGGVTG